MNLEYIGYGRPKFEGDEEFFQEIFNYVNEKNHFILNDKSLIKDGPYSLKFELIFGDITHTFCIGSGGDNNEEEKNEKNTENPEEKKEEEKPKEENTENPEEKNEEEKPKEKKRGEKKGRKRKT